MIQYYWSFHLEDAKKNSFSETNFYYKTSLDNNVMHAAHDALVVTGDVPPKVNVLVDDLWRKSWF